MQTKEIARQGAIPDHELDRNNIFASVLNAGLRHNLLSISEVERIQSQLMQLLGELIMKYTNGQSSSVKTDTAQRIMNSVLYMLDFRLSQIRGFDAEAAVQLLKVESVSRLHTQGMELMKEQFCDAMDLMGHIREFRLAVDLIAYHESMDSIWEDFFAKGKAGLGYGGYDPWFDARNAAGSIDYPLLVDKMDTEGFVYIQAYLEKLDMENCFCSCFAVEDIRQLLAHTAKKSGIPMRELLVNMAELVLLNSICATMLGKNARSIRINPQEEAMLTGMLEKMDASDIQSATDNAVAIISTEIGANEDLGSYLRESARNLGIRFRNAAMQGALSGMIAVDAEGRQLNRASYQTGERMDDSKLRELVDELLHCDNGREKAEILIAELHSLEDLVDVLGAYCIFDDEYNEIYERLDAMTLAMITGMLFDSQYELQCWLQSEGTAAIHFDKLSNSEHELYWKERLEQYLQKCESSRKMEIMGYIDELTR